MSAIDPNVSEKALRDFATRVIMSEISELKPGTTEAEVRFFVDQLPSHVLRNIYGAFYRTGLVT